METLIIVDPQNDFIEGGKLAVTGGKQALDNVIEYINKNLDNINRVIITADWHPGNHSSFDNFGGKFPEHCVQRTYGAQIYKPLNDVVESSNLPAYVLLKGMDTDVDNFTAFESEVSYLRNATIFKTTDKQVTSFMFYKDEQIVICGLAGDYCVLATIKALQKCGLNENIVVYTDGIASIDGGTILENYIENGTEQN